MIRLLSTNKMAQWLLTGSCLGASAGSRIGALAEYILHPANILVGQLPFIVVIMRGTFLTGLDTILVPLARESFNCIFFGLVVGAVIVSVIGGMAGLSIKSLLEK